MNILLLSLANKWIKFNHSILSIVGKSSGRFCVTFKQQQQAKKWPPKAINKDSNRPSFWSTSNNSHGWLGNFSSWVQYPPTRDPVLPAPFSSLTSYRDSLPAYHSSKRERSEFRIVSNRPIWRTPYSYWWVWIFKNRKKDGFCLFIQLSWVLLCAIQKKKLVLDAW